MEDISIEFSKMAFLETDRFEDLADRRKIFCGL
jgi:hypothetical protein